MLRRAGLVDLRADGAFRRYRAPGDGACPPRPEALEKLLDGHPHLQIGTIESHQFLDMPGM